MKNAIVLLLFIVLVFITSCSVEKRHYMKGYDVQWYKKETKSNAFSNSTDVKSDKDNLISNNIADNIEKETTPASNNSIDFDGKTLITEDSCDLIKLKNNTQIKAKITEINSSVIKYKECGDEKGIEKAISKNQVLGINFRNGLEEKYEQSKESEVVPPAIVKKQKDIQSAESKIKKEVKSTYVLGLLSFILLMVAGLLATATVLVLIYGGVYFGMSIFISLCSFACGIASIILGLLAIIKGGITLHRINKNPEEKIYLKKTIKGLSFAAVVWSLLIGAIAGFAIRDKIK